MKFRIHLSYLILLLLLSWSCKSTKTDATQPVTSREAPQAEATQVMAPPAPESGLMGPIPFDPDVVRGTLQNGLQYYIRQNSQPENLAEIRLAINAGSILEEENQQGLAHFLEHMAFNGTKNFPKRELLDFLESIGLRFGAHLNAYTSFDETVYMLRVPTDSMALLQQGMQILEDWAHNLLLEEEEIDQERGVVIEEWRRGLGADERMREKTYPALYYNSRYADRLPIGKKEILENFAYETLREFYQTWYRPDLMAIVVVGDVDPLQVEKMIRDRFSGIPKAVNPQPRKEFPVPDHRDAKVAIATDPEASYNIVRLNYKHPRQEVRTLEDYRSSLISSLVNRMLDARLEELLQKENPPFSYASTRFGSSVRTKSSFSSFAVVPEEGHLRALDNLATENERALRHGFTESELARAKQAIFTSLERQVKEKGKTESARLVWRYVYYFLDGDPAIGEEDRLELTKRLMPDISIAEVNARIKEWVTRENRVVTLTGIQKEGVTMPTQEEVLAVLDKVAEKNIQPYTDEVVREPLMGARPAPGAITSENVIEELGVTELTFANGARVILKPTDFKNDQILMVASSPGGHSLVPDGQYFSAVMADQIVSNSGLGPYDNIQLDKFLTDKVIRLRPYISELEEGFQGSSSVKDFEVFLQMLYLYFEAPRKDPVAFSATMSRNMAMVENMLSDPQNYYYNELNNFLYDNHLRRGILTKEKLAKVNLDDAYRIFQERFRGAGDFTFIFVGNVEADQAKPLLASYIGSLPTGNQGEKWKDVGASMIQGRQNKEFYKGQEPQSQVNLYFTGDFDWNLQSRYNMISMVEVLRIMLRESLREEKGGVYSVSTYASPSRFPKEKYTLSISFGCAPENVEELINTALKDIETLKAEGASEKNLAKVKEIQRKGWEEGLKENAYWRGKLSFFYENDMDPRRMNELPEQIEKLNSEDIQKAAQQYFSMDNYIRSVLYPEEKNAD